MTGRHAIDLALDLARMPALARTSVTPPIPSNVIELMRIAAACPQTCQAAVATTGEPAPVLIEAARFYLQQMLFRPEADCYRILGIKPAASRATARSHMHWLLKWLHPDRNSSWDSIYAERVLKAWHEVSALSRLAARPALPRAGTKSAKKKKGEFASIRLPWIEHAIRHPRARARSSYRTFVKWAVPAGLVIISLALWSAMYYFGLDQTAAMTPLR